MDFKEKDPIYTIRRSELVNYLILAIAAGIGIGALIVLAVYSMTGR